MQTVRSRIAKITLLLMMMVLGVKADMRALPKPKLNQNKPKDSLE